MLSTTDSMDMNLSKLWKIVKDRGDCGLQSMGVTKSWTWHSNLTTNLQTAHKNIFNIHSNAMDINLRYSHTLNRSWINKCLSVSNINFWFYKNKKILHIYIIVHYALNSSCYYYYFVLLNILGEVFQMPCFQIGI